jgi:hypothetical protein
MPPTRYRVVRDASWSWSVVDVTTGEVVAYSNVVLGGLSERLAEDMAKLLNLEHQAADVDIPLAPRSRRK